MRMSRLLGVLGGDRGFYLFKNGDKTNVTGGWTASHATIGTTVSFEIEYDTTTRAGTNNTIDVTQYSKLKCVVESYSASLRVTDDSGFGVSSNNTAANGTKVQITGTGEYEVDISSVSGSRYVVFNFRGSQGGGSITVSKIWLE